MKSSFAVKSIFYIRLIKWGHLGSFFLNSKILTQDLFFSHSECGRIFLWTVFSTSISSNRVTWGIFRNSKILTPSPICFSHSECGGTLKWKVSSCIKSIKWDHMGSFLKIPKFWPQDKFSFSHSECGRILKWKLFFYIKHTGWVTGGHF